LPNVIHYLPADRNTYVWLDGSGVNASAFILKNTAFASVITCRQLVSFTKRAKGANTKKAFSLPALIFTPMLLSIVNIFFLLAFSAFAYVNLNDKDAPLWVTIYMLAAVACGLAAFGLYFPVAYLLLILFYVGYAIVLFFAKDGVRDWVVKYNRPSITESMQATKPYIEKTREFFGLLIISAALALNYFVAP
jgi:hypothetical protein